MSILFREKVVEFRPTDHIIRKLFSKEKKTMTKKKGERENGVRREKER